MKRKFLVQQLTLGLNLVLLLFNNPASTQIEEAAKAHSAWYNLDGRNNWQYIDDLFDRMLAIGVRPFVKLGFVPKAQASTPNTTFWLRGNSAPPSDYQKWGRVVSKFTGHWISCYEIDGVKTCYFEVWNEPDLHGFWDGTKSQYFELYRTSANALKAIDKNLRVGGPATSNFVPDERFGGEVEDKTKPKTLSLKNTNTLDGKAVWVEDFMTYCAKENLPVDFISTHPYPTDWAIDLETKKGGRRVRCVNATTEDLEWFHKTIATSPYPNVQIHCAEWSCSPSPRDATHDSLQAATYVIKANVDSIGEPETNADQNRLMSIIRTNDTSGYHVDIFRYRKKNGGDKSHDYIYHNLGQQVNLAGRGHQPLNLQPTDKLTFANMELMGYDYWWDKKSVTTSDDFNTRFDLRIPGRQEVSMNMWMKGYPGREVFSVKAPPSRSWRGNEIIPDSIANMPLPTVVVHQTGEAWNRPFVTIYELAHGTNGSSVERINSFHASGTDSSFVGIMVKSKNGFTDYIMSEDGDKTATYKEIKFKGSYCVARNKKNELHYLFLGKRYSIGQNGYSIEAVKPTAATLSFSNEKIYFTIQQPAKLTIPDKGGIKYLLLNLTGNTVKIVDQRGSVNGRRSITFDMPAMPLTELTTKI